MRKLLIWNALGLVLLLVAVGLYLEGAKLARERATTLQILTYFEDLCGPAVDKAIFSSYFGRPNTSRDVEDAHKLTGGCQQVVLSWMRNEGLSNPGREELLKQAVFSFDSELARRVNNNQVLPTKLSDAGYHYPAQGNPSASIALGLLVAAMGAFGRAAVCRRTQRELAQARAANEQTESEEPLSISLEVFNYEQDVSDRQSVEDIEDAEDFADDDEFEYDDEYENEDEQVDEHLLEHDARLESLERQLHRQESQQAQREKKAERERLDAQRREERDRREQARLMEKDRSRREFDERLQRQKDRERQEREQAARNRADENTRREQERTGREKQRREKADHERREREVEIVYNLKAGGHHVVAAGSAAGAQMMAENRLRSSQSVRGYVIRNKNGKVISSG